MFTHRMLVVESQRGKDQFTPFLFYFFSDDKVKVIVDDQTYSGNCSIWLKNGHEWSRMAQVPCQRRGCPGWVIDMNAQTLHK